MSSDSGKRKIQDGEEGPDYSDNGKSQHEIDEIKIRRKVQNKIRCQRYRDKKKSCATVSSQMDKHKAITVDEEEKNKRRKEYDKQKSQRYRDKKRAKKLLNLDTDQPSKTVVRHVPKCKNFHNTQITGPSTRNVSYVSPIHSADVSTPNDSYIKEPHSDSDDDIRNDTPSQVNYVPQFHEPIVTIHVPITQNILPLDVHNNTQLKMSSDVDGGKTKKQDDNEGADIFDDGTNQHGIDEMKMRRKDQNKIRCRRYRAKKKVDAIVSSQIDKRTIMTVEEEEKLKLRRKYEKQKSQRYRDRKRANNLNDLHTDQSSKIVVWHLSKCQNFHKSPIAGPSTNVSYVPPVHTADVFTRNEPYIPESHSDYDEDIRNDTPSQVNYDPQLHEPLITIHVPITQNTLPRDVQNNTKLKTSSDIKKTKRQDGDEGEHFSDDGTRQNEIDEIKITRKVQNKIRCQRYRNKKKKNSCNS